MALITQIPKNCRDEFRGCDPMNIRVYLVSEDGEMRPSKQGVSFRTSLLPDFSDALSKVEAG